MKLREIDNGPGRSVMIGLITSKEFLAQASTVLDPDIIGAEHIRICAKWCLNHYAKHKTPIGRKITEKYEEWSKTADKTINKLVNVFLSSIDEEYERDGDQGIGYLTDTLERYINSKKAERVSDNAKYLLERGESIKAVKEIEEFHPVKLSGSQGTCLGDMGVWDRAFAAPLEPLIEFEDDAGRFFNAALTREALVGIQAPDKVGKTWFCVEFALQALRQHRRVAFFSMGDLTEEEVALRFAVSISGIPLRPVRRGRIEWPCEIEIDEGEDAGYRVLKKDRLISSTLDKHRAIDSIKKFFCHHGMCRRSGDKREYLEFLRFMAFPTSTASVKDIAAAIQMWESVHNFVPDVIVIDYADIVAPETSDAKAEYRHQQNSVWLALRRLSQERHALVIVPTQSKATAYKKMEDADKLQGMSEYSEDKRKLAHCTGMMALNQSADEKEAGGMRINWIVLRNAPFSTKRPLYVGTCFALGRAICCAKWPK